MTGEYDPTKDPASDGFKRVANTPEPPDDGTALSRAAWNAGQSGAPSLFDNPTFKKWGKRILWMVLAVVGFWIGSEIIAAYKAYKAESAKIESAPVVLSDAKPSIDKRIFKPKSATKEIADKASNTQATDEFVPEVVITVNEQSTVVVKPEVMRTWGEHPVPPLPPAPLN